MINVAIAIDGESVNVSRTTRAAGYYTDTGSWVDGAAVSSSIRAAIQPIGLSGSSASTGNELVDAINGTRVEARWVCWSRSELALDDVITSKSVTYRVLFVWPRDEGGFYRAALGRDIP